MLEKTATNQGWNNASSSQQVVIFSITHNSNPTTISITKELHYIKMDALRSQCKRFMIEGGAQHQANQNSQMLKERIWGLLKLRTQQCLAQYKSEYTFNGLGCVPLLLNIIRRTVTGIGQHTLTAQASEIPSKKGIVQAKVP